VNFHVEDCHGAKLIVAEKAPQPAPPGNGVAPVARQRRPKKPAGLPSIADMIMTVIKQKDIPEEGLAPREITGVIRRVWWPDVEPRCIHGATWAWPKKGGSRTTAAAIG
jgi:hypothetical protein